MVTDDHGEVRDPLLVRPYLHNDADTDPSAQTWPAATTREVRSQRALEGADDPTAIIPIVPPEATRRRVPRRLLVVLAACAALLLGATAAGFAAMRAARPAITAPQPDAPLPALTGLVPASPASPSAPAALGSVAVTPTHKPSAHRSSSAPATGAKSTAKPSPPAGTSSRKTGSPSADLKPAVARAGTIRGQNGLCLDLAGGVPVAFNQIQVAGCDGAAAQTWTLATDGTLRVEGMCALVVGDETVHIITCDTRTTAQWRADGQLLINAANGECLTDPSAGTRPGTTVVVAPCGGSASQRWSLP